MIRNIFNVQINLIFEDNDCYFNIDAVSWKWVHADIIFTFKIRFQILSPILNTHLQSLHIPSDGRPLLIPHYLPHLNSPLALFLPFSTSPFPRLLFLFSPPFLFLLLIGLEFGRILVSLAFSYAACHPLQHQ